MFTSFGTLHYSNDPAHGPKVHVEVDPEIVRYARALVPKTVKLNPQRWAPHITVVRKEPVVDLSAWGKYDGHPVEFTYDPRVVPGAVYYWLRAWSTRLTEIRVELGLEPLAWACRPPDGEDCFHITLGNTKVLGA